LRSEREPLLNKPRFHVIAIRIGAQRLTDGLADLPERGAAIGADEVERRLRERCEDPSGSSAREQTSHGLDYTL